MTDLLSLSAGQYFVTGTDTEVGKTYFCCHWLAQLARQGYRTTAIKPVAAGAMRTSSGLRNDDALSLQQHVTQPMDYDVLNPVCYVKPVSPHLAADPENECSAQQLFANCQPGLQQISDYCLVEGAGGWFCPINQTETLADFVKLLNIPIIVVVAMRLGCLNHALLTVQAIEQTGLHLAGWVANCIDPDMLCLQDNIDTLRQRIAAPLLVTLEYKP